MMKVDFEGVEELQQALEDIEKRSTRVAVARRAMRKAAGPMLDKAKRYAAHDTGRLEREIRIGTRVKGDAGKAAYAATMRATGGDGAAAVAALRDARRAAAVSNPPIELYLGPTTRAWHGHFVEFGTRPHIVGGKFAGARHPGTSPDPFLRPAFDTEAEATIGRLKPLLWAEIEKHAARVANRAGR